MWKLMVCSSGELVSVKGWYWKLEMEGMRMNACPARYSNSRGQRSTKLSTLVGQICAFSTRVSLLALMAQLTRSKP
jgi:hypothetical protein